MYFITLSRSTYLPNQAESTLKTALRGVRLSSFFKRRLCDGLRIALNLADLDEVQRLSCERILLAKSLRIFVRAAASSSAPSPRSGEGWGEAVALWIRQQYPKGRCLHHVHLQRANRATIRSRPTRYMLSKRGGLTSPPDTATRKANKASLGLRASSSISALVVTSI